MLSDILMELLKSVVSELLVLRLRTHSPRPTDSLFALIVSIPSFIYIFG